jgi:hypothetical protein
METIGFSGDGKAMRFQRWIERLLGSDQRAIGPRSPPRPAGFSNIRDGTRDPGLVTGASLEDSGAGVILFLKLFSVQRRIADDAWRGTQSRDWHYCKGPERYNPDLSPVAVEVHVSGDPTKSKTKTAWEGVS